MRIDIAAVGRLKDGPERELYQTYVARLDALGRSHALGPLKLHEVPESRAKTVSARKDDEAGRLSACVDMGGVVIALDESGQAMSSVYFAKFLQSNRDDGVRVVTFAIGGADGHGAQIKTQARLVLSLGAMTLPHGLARVVLIEQLYRATTIIAGHPYHRA